METAKLFKIGRYQAIRLPEHFHFAETEVAIRKDGDSVILSPISKKKSLETFLALPGCSDFCLERDSVQQIQKRGNHLS